MSPQELKPAQTIADRLSFAIRRLEELEWLTLEQHVSVEWTAPLNPGAVELNVHGVEPVTLLELRTSFPDAREHIDADGILRWLELDLDGVNATFYRR